MNILTALSEKPWEENPNPQMQKAVRERVRISGLRVLLTVVSVLFFLFIVAFLMRSQYPDWQPLAEQASHPLYDKTQLWLNSIYLILASVGMQIARMSSRGTKRQLTKGALIVAGVFSSAFVAGQLLFWQQLTAQGFTVDANPALSFFYLFTGLHALHVAIGLITWLVALRITLFSDPTAHAEKINHYIELCAMYWHFLLGLWVLLFALLISKPETYNAIVEFCGLGGGV
ncbi:MAG: hypothetical protein Alis3KO_23730 [Aliiglaciecola sp.]|uniref:cytochrome c oxidase subunit 3 n=1 Tax=Aliiglaciecola sp. M165 TaxID=2593649 RepID=UPI00117D7DED|nr:cytochrome c oxidase subunit 3 [Aliiglaciecola sp. M165]TRY33288.1 cytochrome c oxidase subunit III [Aliiglaciecola sp. M165]